MYHWSLPACLASLYGFSAWFHSIVTTVWLEWARRHLCFPRFSDETSRRSWEYKSPHNYTKSSNGVLAHRITIPFHCYNEYPNELCHSGVHLTTSSHVFLKTAVAQKNHRRGFGRFLALRMVFLAQMGRACNGSPTGMNCSIVCFMA